MRNKYFWSITILFCVSVLQSVAQTNYVANVANSGTPGYNNTLLGPFSGNSSSTGNDNAFLGYSTGQTTSSGSYNAFIGSSAGFNNIAGSYNSFLGYRAGYGNTSGSYNVLIGYAAGISNRTGEQNTFLGVQAGLNNFIGSANVAIGSRAGYSNRTDSYNVVIGDSAGYNNATSNNLFVGSKAGFTNQTGQKGTFLGYQSGYNAVADSNTFVGYQSGYATTIGKGNTFFGVASGKSNITGNHNTFVGNGAGPTSTSTDDNIYVGYNTGHHDSGSRNTLLGTGTDVLANNLQNATAIGAGATVAISDALILGNQVNVGIGTSAPSTRLEVVSPDDHDSGLRLSKLTTNSPTTQHTDQFLTVNERGDVIKARYHLRINNATEWSDKVFAPTYQLRPLATVATYIRENGHLPGVPSANEVVKEGVDLVRMNATLLEKVEELTLYSIQLAKELQLTKQQQQKEIDELKRLIRQVVKP